MPGRSVRFIRMRPALTASWLRGGALLFASLMLAGCAAQLAYRDGKDLIAQGKIEVGLLKLQEAAKLDPGSIEYRTAYFQVRDRAIEGFLDQAGKLSANKKWNEADALYQRVLAIESSNNRAKAGLGTNAASRNHEHLLADAKTALEKKDIDTARAKLGLILRESPHHSEAQTLKRAIEAEISTPAVESALQAAYRKPITIEFKDVPLKRVFEVISRTSGLNIIFDKDVKTDQRTSIFLKNSTIASAIHFALLTNQLEQQVLDGNTILIYPNTPAKQKDYQEMMVRTFYLSNADAKTVANTLKTIVKSRDVVTDEKLNMLIVRDSPEAIRLAEKLVALHDIPEPEVMLEVEILEVSRTRLQELGIKWPDSLGLTPLPSTSGGTLTLRDLRTNINGSTLGAAVGPVTVNVKGQDSDANILANPRIRARNHEKAKILIGERVPNITTTSTSTGFVSESINYVDVGLKLDVEPSIHLDNDVAIKIALEVSNIVSQLQTKTGTTAYQIGTRTASTVLRLKDGENQVLAGLINNEDRTSSNNIPGLGALPVVGRLFGSSADNKLKTEIVLSITPHIIRNIQRPDAAMAEFRSGTESSLRIRPEGGAGGVMSTTPVRTPTAGQQLPQTPMQTPSSRPSGIAAVPSAAPVPSMSGGVQSGDIGVMNSSSAAVSGALIRWDGPTQVKTGNEFSVRVMMQSDQPVTSLPLAIGFDKRSLQVIGISEGDFLKQGGAQTNFTSRVDPTGQILLSLSRMGDVGATSLGTVATVNFRALAPADASQVQLLTMAPVGIAGRTVAAATPAPYVVQVRP
jgi:general secretion pathway protein D